MIKTTIYLKNLDEKNSEILEGKIAYIDGVEDYEMTIDSIEMLHDENIITKEDLITAIEDLGFDVSQKPFNTINKNKPAIIESTNKKNVKSLKTKIYIPDIECESCSRLIEKKMSHIDGIENYKINGVIHSFTSDWPTAQKYLNLGFYLGFNGIITFPSSLTVLILLRTSLEVPAGRDNFSLPKIFSTIEE